MRVLYVASGTRMSGGATKSFLAMLREADKAGIEYRVVCPDTLGLTRCLEEKGVYTYVRHFRHNRYPSTQGIVNLLKWLPRLIHDNYINWKAKRRLYEDVKDFNPDIVHENSSAVNIGYYIAKRLDVPYIMHIREYGDLDFQITIPDVGKRMADPGCWTISITKDIFLRKKQDRNPHATQIYNGIMTMSQLRFTPHKKRYFLYAGRIEPAKGTSELIDAYLKYLSVEKDPVPLKIAGGCNHPDYCERLKDKVAHAGCSDMVEWLGDRDDVCDLMFEAAATVIPSRFEALGRVMPEAMANGSLCVGRDTGGTKEQMDNGLEFTGNEIALRFTTVDDLAGVFSYITCEMKDNDPFASGGAFRDMIDRSQRSVCEFFSEEQFGKRLLSFYDKILNG